MVWPRPPLWYANVRECRNLKNQVGEKAGEEESLSGVRQKLSVVERQLGSERGRVRDYEERFLEQENEIGKLRKLTADLKTHLHHELAGLDLPRSRPASLPQVVMVAFHQIGKKIQ